MEHKKIHQLEILFLQIIHPEPLYQSSGDETEKGLAVDEQPSEMSVTAVAEHHLPAITREPSELGGRLAVWRYPRCFSKAAQFKGNPRWIEKGMLMPIVDP